MNLSLLTLPKFRSCLPLSLAGEFVVWVKVLSRDLSTKFYLKVAIKQPNSAT